MKQVEPYDHDRHDHPLAYHRGHHDRPWVASLGQLDQSQQVQSQPDPLALASRRDHDHCDHGHHVEQYFPDLSENHP